MKSHYSFEIYAGLGTSTTGLTSSTSSNYFKPTPKYFLINWMNYQKVIYPSLSVSRTLNIYVKSSFEGFLLKKKQAYKTSYINY